MRHYYPAYYKEFRCIAADCPDSCCQGWDVVIDSETEAFYHSVQGNFGEKLRSAIYTDSDGDRVFHLEEEKKCPFWGSDRLCDIYKELGEEHLSATCARFPRLSMDYSAFTEHSLALACPEAARLIVNTDNAYSSLTHEQITECEDYNADIMNLLLKARRQSANILTARKPLSERLRECLFYNREVQSLISETSVEDAACDIPQAENTTAPNIKKTDFLFDFYQELEYIDSKNREKILQACQSPINFAEQEASLEQLSLYYLYRYYLTAIDTLDVLTPIKHMVISLILISASAHSENCTIAEAAQLYSKETEQSYENMELVYDTLTFDTRFCVENLISLL